MPNNSQADMFKEELESEYKEQLFLLNAEQMNAQTDEGKCGNARKQMDTYQQTIERLCLRPSRAFLLRNLK